MKLLASDSTLIFDYHQDRFVNLRALYVDDSLRTGESRFLKKCAAAMRKFVTTAKTEPPLELTGVSVGSLKDGMLSIIHGQYLCRFKELPKDADFIIFGFMRMKLVWLENSLPDVLYEIPTLMQVTQDIFTDKKLQSLKGFHHAFRYTILHRITAVVPKLEEATKMLSDAQMRP